MPSRTAFPHPQSLGAFPTSEGAWFRVRAPKAAHAAVVIVDESGHGLAHFPLTPRRSGLFEGFVAEAWPGTLYKIDLDGQWLPDPFARWLPFGVHGPAAVWHQTYDFQYQAPVLRPDQLVIYELHIGSFTREGTYAAAAGKLPYLKELGITAVELMPIAAFAGGRGWGYDGVAWFAPHPTYGTPDELSRFIDEAHHLGMLVLLDVVYNHFGPDGNYLWTFDRRSFSRTKTPWGNALNFRNRFLRRMVLDNAAHWLQTYHFDGLRLDATNQIHDPSPVHILHELADHVRGLNGRHWLIAEDGRNEPALVTQAGLDGLWSDDFHHQVHVLLTGERDGYYAGFQPNVADLARLIERGWLHEGPDRGRPADDLAARHFVNCLQNHDQIGNRALGDRLHHGISLDAYLAASALLLFLPMTPLLFMGQEWAASTPFRFFSDHAQALGRAVTLGRRREFRRFGAFSGPKRVRLPDPQARSTFQAATLRWNEREQGDHGIVLAAYRQLLHLRRTDPVLAHSDRNGLNAGHDGDMLWVRRQHEGETRLLLVNFGEPRTPSSLGVDLGEVLYASGWANRDWLPRYGTLIGAT